MKDHELSFGLWVKTTLTASNPIISPILRSLIPPDPCSTRRLPRPKQVMSAGWHFHVQDRSIAGTVQFTMQSFTRFFCYLELYCDPKSSEKSRHWPSMATSNEHCKIWFRKVNIKLFHLIYSYSQTFSTFRMTSWHKYCLCVCVDIKIQNPSVVDLVIQLSFISH